MYLERPRIDRLLEKAVQNPIVTVVAGAGYGKSQAVYSFARKCSVRTAWVQFSEGDNVSGRFWEKFVDAIAVLSRESADKLAEIGFPETERQFSRYTAISGTDIISADKYIFVYDDIHLIRDRAVLGFIGRSIHAASGMMAPFPNITSIIISRNEPELDLARFESRGQVSHISEEDLRFSKDETVEYFRLLGLRPSLHTISAIYGDTEGWVFATHLAGLSLAHSKTGDTYVPQALRANIFKLMESEIFSGLPKKLQTFLVKLSLIEHLVPDLLREIVGREEKNYSLIDEMEQLGSFIQYDTYLNAYRIHLLFLDFLKGRQFELSEDEKRDVWLKAADWCLRNNHKINAITYYEKAGDYRKLLDAFYTFPLAFSRQTAALLMKIMDNAPPELYEQIPSAYALRRRLLVNLEMFDQAKEELTVIIAKLERRQCDKEIARTLTGCYNHMGFLGLITCIYTHDYTYVRYFERAHYYSDISGSETSPPALTLNLSSYACRAVETAEMESYNEAISGMVLHTTATMNGYAYGMDDLAWAELAFFKGDLSRAESLAQTARDKAREKNQYEIENCSLFYLLRINLCRGNSDAIPDLLRQIEELRNQPSFLNRFIYYDIVLGLFYVQIGRLEKTASWLKSDFEESELNSWMIHGLEILVKAKCHFAEKRYPAVLANLEGRQEKYSTWSFVLCRLEAKVLEAVCRYRLNDSEGAFRDLEAAWDLAKGNGLYMPFTELGKDMRALAGAALKEPSVKIPKPELEKIQRNAALYAKNIFAVSEQYDSSKTQKSKAGSSLSPREMDVLTGLSQGLTREEIARVSSISVNTVKSAIRSVFNKLGAVNRADAVRIAAELGIL
ncbi:hypothetical protein AGMMS50293_22880 [Spirochaetia bacterium]|nr:hypothetical protein AGMMS50293_22880 [Spirochaetia bacterium]